MTGRISNSELVKIFVVFCTVCTLAAAEQNDNQRLEKIEKQLKETRDDIVKLAETVDVLKTIIAQKIDPFFDSDQSEEKEENIAEPAKRMSYYGSRGKRVRYFGARGKKSLDKRLSYYGSRGKRNDSG